MKRQIILTSAGFSNKNIEKSFLTMLGINPQYAKALFIPTAAINDDAKVMLPICRQDLLNAGILDENIISYDLDKPLDYEYAKQFHVIYFCGGSPEHLINRIHDVDFHLLLEKLLDYGVIYVGVSAGSIIATTDLPDGLHYINCKLRVHQKKGTPCGLLPIDYCPEVSLTDKQAIRIVNDEISIFE